MSGDEGGLETRHHITVQADPTTHEWQLATIEYAGEVNLKEYMGKQDTANVFHTMHYLTQEIKERLPEDVLPQAQKHNDIAVTIRTAG